MFKCDSCRKVYTRKDNLNRHPCSAMAASGPSRKILKSVGCGGAYTRKDALNQHSCSEMDSGTSKLKLADNLNDCRKRAMDDGSGTSIKRRKLDAQVLCSTCDILVPKWKYQGHLRSLQHKGCIPSISVGNGVELIQSIFKNRIASYKITNKSKCFIDVKEFMGVIKEKVLAELKVVLDQNTSVKTNFELFATFLHPIKNIEDMRTFNTKNKIITYSTDLEGIYSEFTDEIDNRVSTFEGCGSGWILKNILHLEINIGKYNPLRASLYIDLPTSVKKKMAVINVQNSDEKCFMWCILAALHPTSKKPERVTKYLKFQDELNFDGIEFPVALKSISKFEKLNDISVNVYGLDSVYKDGSTVIEVVGPLHFTKTHKPKHVNLLLIDDGNGNYHYCLIKNLAKLIGSQLSKHGHHKFLCDGCLVYFNNEEQLHEHQQHDCGRISINLPSTYTKIDKFGNIAAENILKFQNFEKKLKVPFVVYADFESMLIPIQGCQPSNESAFTQKIAEHVPYSFAYYIKCDYDDSLSKFETYRGIDCTDVFYTRLVSDVKRIYHDYLKPIALMPPLNDEQKLIHQTAPNCHICEKPFLEGERRVHDHNHLGAGVYRGPAHNTCNLNFKLDKFIPVFFHNLSNYDAHLFIKALSSDKDDGRIDVLAENKEKYISFSKHIFVDRVLNDDGEYRSIFMKIRFLDSFRFMSTSLDNLSKNLKDDQCGEIRKYFTEGVKFDLIRQKGVFPYSYIDSVERLNERQLPSQLDFYNNLTKEGVSDSDYARAKFVWETFNCQTLGDYSDVYLQSDVLLLTSAFEAFRDVCMSAYSLDPCQFYTAPSLSWTAMLKYTGIKLELLTNADMVHFIKKGIRGGIAQCSGRKAIANNKYIPNYDSSLPSSFINYLDATNLYGAAMSCPLPTSDFAWLSEPQVFDVASVIDENSSEGYILEVDLDYPKELHDLHNDLPFCAENLIPPGSKLPKLIPNLNNKKRYVIHYRNLKQCLNAGLKLLKIHRILKFKQSAWLKDYIDLNTRMRNNATSKFEKDFYKLMNNCVYGKTMENVDRRVDIRLATHWEDKGRRVGAQSLIARPGFKNCTIFSKNLVAIQMEKLSVTYDKPTYVGFCVLELSKLIMYDFYYNSIKKDFGDKAHLLYTDTDSLIMETFIDDFYEYMKNSLSQYDTSNFDQNNQFDIPVNESIIGKMKDEYAGRIIWEFYGTGAKAYITNVEGGFEVDGKTTKRAKGVNSLVVRNELDVEDYKHVVENAGVIYREMSTFRSHSHTIYTEMKNKIALSSADDKRYVIPRGDGRTLAWGHYRILNV